MGCESAAGACAGTAGAGTSCISSSCSAASSQVRCPPPNSPSGRTTHAVQPAHTSWEKRSPTQLLNNNNNKTDLVEEALQAGHCVLAGLRQHVQLARQLSIDRGGRGCMR